MRPFVFAFAALVALCTAAMAQDAAPPPADNSAAPAPAAPVNPPPANPAMTGPRLLISTTMGDITVQLDGMRAPKTVANILRYVREKHYDGTAVYRVVKGFVIQLGSWDANVKARPVHAPVAFEGGNGLSNLRGSVALARGDDPNSGNAEFFIDLVDNSGLDHSDAQVGYTVFGQVISGMEVADQIGEVPVGDHGPMPGQAPVTPIVVKKVSVLP
jgi:cyclophilin family peptidyl-prolyl cis-trans isomerase